MLPKVLVITLLDVTTLGTKEDTSIVEDSDL